MADQRYTPPAEYVTVAQAGTLLGCSPMTARKRLRQAGLKMYRDLRDPRVRLLLRAEVEALAARSPIVEIVEDTPDTKRAA
jgi:hypothetical protein